MEAEGLDNLSNLNVETVECNWITQVEMDGTFTYIYQKLKPNVGK